jgi:ParB family chromosome partitioning protein
MMNIDSINTASPFRDLFPIEDNLVKELYWDMQKNGFDTSKPIVLWKGKSVVIDGHTRLRAARKAGLYDVPVVMKDFEDVEDALEYAIKSQRNRRNLTDKEIIRCIAELDKRRTAGRPSNEKLASGDANFGKSASETASTLGISTCKVERARTVLNKAPEEVKEAVKSGKITINSAYNKTVHPEKEKKGQESPPAETQVDKVEKTFQTIKEKLTNEKLTIEEIEKLITLLLEELNQLKGEDQNG